jgi:hypothetical protein
MVCLYVAAQGFVQPEHRNSPCRLNRLLACVLADPFYFYYAVFGDCVVERLFFLLQIMQPGQSVFFQISHEV